MIKSKYKKKVGCWSTQPTLCGLLVCVMLLLLLRLEGPGGSSAFVVSLDPVVTAALPLRSRSWSWHRRRSSCFSLGSVIGRAASGSRSRSCNCFVVRGGGIVVIIIVVIGKRMVLKSHHDCASSPHKVASRRRTASWSRNFDIVESHRSLVISRRFDVTQVASKAGSKLGPLVLISVLLSVHRLRVSSCSGHCIP
jgi:hypothetical protein